jgi:hypothetical protein
MVRKTSSETSIRSDTEEIRKRSPECSQGPQVYQLRARDQSKDIATGNSQMFPRVFTRATHRCTNPEPEETSKKHRQRKFTNVPQSVHKGHRCTNPEPEETSKKHRQRKFANVPQSVHKGHTQVYQPRARGDQ